MRFYMAIARRASVQAREAGCSSFAFLVLPIRFSSSYSVLPRQSGGCSECSRLRGLLQLWPAFHGKHSRLEFSVPLRRINTPLMPVRKVTSNEDRSPDTTCAQCLHCCSHPECACTGYWSTGNLPVRIPAYPLWVPLQGREKNYHMNAVQNRRSPQLEAISRSVCRTFVNIIYFIFWLLSVPPVIL